MSLYLKMFEREYPFQIRSHLPDINSRRFAYVWYFYHTMPEYALEYACSAIVAMRRLQTLREESALQADYVLVYGASLLNTRWRNWSSVLASVNILHDPLSEEAEKMTFI